MTMYRRKKGRYTWHWCKNCPNFPKGSFDLMYIKSTKIRPPTKKFCKKCEKKEKRNDCRSY